MINVLDKKINIEAFYLFIACTCCIYFFTFVVVHNEDGVTYYFCFIDFFFGGNKLNLIDVFEFFFSFVFIKFYLFLISTRRMYYHVCTLPKGIIWFNERILIYCEQVIGGLIHKF